MVIRLFAKIGLFAAFLVYSGTGAISEPAGYTLAGTVVGLTDNPFGEAAVALYTPSSIFETASDHGGLFKFTGVPAGHYQLQAMGPGTRRTVMEIDVPKESASPIDVKVSFAHCDNPTDALPTYRFNPNNQSQARLEGVIGASESSNKVTIKIVNSDTKAEYVSKDRKGRFTFAALAAGRYTLTASRKGASTLVVSDLWAISGRTGRVLLRMSAVGTMCQ